MAIQTNRRDIESQNFLTRVDHAEIAASSTLVVPLGSIYTKYGYNFNTLTIINTADEDIEIYLDGEKTQHVLGGNQVFSFDHEFNLWFSELKIENTDAAAAVAANEVKISIGRTGKQGGGNNV